MRASRMESKRCVFGLGGRGRLMGHPYDPVILCKRVPYGVLDGLERAIVRVIGCVQVDQLGKGRRV